MKNIFRLLLVVFFLISIPSNGTAQDLPPGLDHYVHQAMHTFQVPGVSLAIVKDGHVLLAKGYGVIEVGKDDKVDKHTLFCIASNSKAFTSTALGLLVEKGKIRWDDPVIDYLPWFRMSNSYVTSHMTIRDLLVHRSGLGLGASDLLQFPPSDYSRKEMAKKLRYVPLASSFRSKFAYDNILYLVAGEVIHAVSGMSWEEFVKTHIMSKIGMNESTVRISQFDSQPNTAVSNIPFEGKVIPNPNFPDNELTDASNPAGGIASNASDMSKWVITLLNSGKAPNGTQLFDPYIRRFLWSMVTPIPISKAPPMLQPEQKNFFGYGLGFFLRDYRGYKMIYHTGGLAGFLSKVTIIPELNLGVVVLTNQESGAAFSSITNHILDYYMDASHFDWIKGYKKYISIKNKRTQAITNRRKATRDSLAGPSLPLKKYAGTYHDAWYGDIAVSLNNDQLAIHFTHSPGLTGKMIHWQYDTFLVRWNDRQLRADAFITFSLNPDGSIYKARMKPASPAVDFSYDFQDLLLKPVSN